MLFRSTSREESGPDHETAAGPLVEKLPSAAETEAGAGTRSKEEDAVFIVEGSRKRGPATAVPQNGLHCTSNGPSEMAEAPLKNFFEKSFKNGLTFKIGFASV